MPIMSKAVDLKLNRELIDPKFEGYKLGLDPIPVKTQDLSQDVLNRKANDKSQWSYLHVRLFASANQLHFDQYSPTASPTFYLFLQDGIYQSQYQLRQRSWCNTPNKVADLILPKDVSNRGDIFPPSIQFVSKDYVALSYGCGSVFIYATPDRNSNQAWTLLHEEKKLTKEGSGFVLFDGRIVGDDKLEVLTFRVEEDQDLSPDSASSSFIGFLEIFTFKKSGDVEWSLERSRIVECKSYPEYAALSGGIRDESILVCASSASPRIIHDSAKPVQLPEEKSDSKDGEFGKASDEKFYSWGQTSGEVSAVFSVGNDITKNDINWRLSSDQLYLEIKDCVVMDGQPGGSIDVGASTWTLLDSRIEITLSKSLETSEMNWTDFIVGDNRGEYVPDPELVQQAAEAMKNMITENGSGDDGGRVGFNSGQLEECDQMNPGDIVQIYWISLDDHSVKFTGDVSGRQWLSVCPSKEDWDGKGLRPICLRHDVDGILWSILPEDGRVTHIATFNALGYVQASKLNRKFTLTSADYSYAAIVDGNKHSYIYWQPSAVETSLMNRKTKQKISAISKQQLVTLEENEEIIGAYALSHALILLTPKRLYSAVLIQDFSAMDDDKFKSD